MGADGHQRALARYEIGATTTELVRLLSEAIEQRHAPHPIRTGSQDPRIRLVRPDGVTLSAVANQAASTSKRSSIARSSINAPMFATRKISSRSCACPG